VLEEQPVFYPDTRRSMMLTVYVVDVGNILRKVKLVETLNPCAQGFRASKIEPRIEEGLQGEH
jgi:hypothetical protein